MADKTTLKKSTETGGISIEQGVGCALRYGLDGKSAYKTAFESGYTGTEEQFNRTLSEQPVIETITGSSVTLDIRGGHAYLCGELASLTIASVEDTAREVVIRFTTGAVPPVLNFPASLGIWGDYRPRALSLCEMNICYGEAVITWRQL